MSAVTTPYSRLIESGMCAPQAEAHLRRLERAQAALPAPIKAPEPPPAPARKPPRQPRIFPLGRTQKAVLVRLEQGPATIPQLQEVAAVTHSTMSCVMTRLMGRGLVVRHAYKAKQGRGWKYRLARKGKAL